jgi:DNA-binding MarR family transcriptional regulator
MKTRLGQSNPRYQALLQLLRTADTIWNASRAFFDRWDLGPSQFNVLNLLRLHPGGLSQTELSRELIMHRSNVTGLVDRLERRGLVERKDAADDRRAYRVVLTDEGSALLDQILPEYFVRADGLWNALSSNRITALVEDLEVIAGNVERAAKELPGNSKGGK